MTVPAPSFGQRLSRRFWETTRQMAEWNYYLARSHYQWMLGREQRGHEQPPVLIFQMGKVGSTTLARSLRALNLDRPVYHSHLLSWPRIKETERQRRKLFLTERYSHLKRPWLNRFIRKQIDRGLKDGKWKIISLVRDPVARNVSTFFENQAVEVIADNRRYQFSSDYYGFGPLVVDIEDLDELIDVFFQKFKHETPLTFFDREFREALGFDVFAHNFDQKKGYAIYPGKTFDVLLIRLEDLNVVAENAMAEFLGIRDFKLVQSNIGHLKPYAAVYKKIKKSIVFPDQYLDRFYDSPFLHHFYSATEIAGMRSAWKSRT